MSQNNIKTRCLLVNNLSYYNQLMQIEHPDYEELDLRRFDTVMSWTADFGDGMQMDIKVCTSDDGEPVWCEAVLFHNGFEVNYSDTFDELDGEWGLEYKGTRYITKIVEKNELADQIVDLVERILIENDIHVPDTAGSTTQIGFQPETFKDLAIRITELLEPDVTCMFIDNGETTTEENNTQAGRIHTLVAVHDAGPSDRFALMIQLEQTADGHLDPEEAIAAAVAQYLDTKDGKDMLERNDGNFNYGDFVSCVPDSITVQHGFRIKSYDICDRILDHNESLVPERF